MLGKILLNFLIIIVEAVAWSYLMNNVMTIKNRYSKQFIFFCKFLLIVLLCFKQLLPNNILSVPQSLILTWLFYIVFSFIVYSEHFIIKLAWYLILLVCLAVPEAVVLQIMKLALHITLKDLTTNLTLVTITILLSRMLSFLLIKLISGVKKNIYGIYRTFYKEFITLLILTFIILFTSAFLYMNYNKYSNNMHNIFIIINAEIATVLIICLIVIFKILIKSNDLIRQNQEIKDLEYQLQLDKQITVAETNLRSLRHNISNTFGIIKGLIKNNCYEELNDYLDGIYKDIDAANEIPFTNNKPLSALIYNKKKLAKQFGVDFQNIIYDCTIINVNNYDLCALLGNIWDNAIEASSKCETQKYVRTTIQVTEHHYTIECENSYKYIPEVKNGIFISKKNKENDNVEHGIGTKNINYIVNNWHGKINICYKNKIFKIKILFFIKKVSEGELILLSERGNL